MKLNQYRGILGIAVLVMAVGVNTGQARDMPQISYACHVVTGTAFPAVVLVQANNLEEALVVARRSPATTFEGFPAQTSDVVECILPAVEKFQSPAVQLYFEKMDR